MFTVQILILMTTTAPIMILMAMAMVPVVNEGIDGGKVFLVGTDIDKVQLSKTSDRGSRAGESPKNSSPRNSTPKDSSSAPSKGTQSPPNGDAKTSPSTTAKAPNSKRRELRWVTQLSLMSYSDICAISLQLRT